MVLAELRFWSIFVSEKICGKFLCQFNLQQKFGGKVSKFKNFGGSFSSQSNNSTFNGEKLWGWSGQMAKSKQVRLWPRK